MLSTRVARCCLRQRQFFEWNENFGLSCITAGSQKAYIDIYPASWDGTRGFADVPARVELEPGCSIVFHGLARHRGVAYSYQSLRLYLSYVVRSIFALSSDKDKVVKTNDLEASTTREPVALPLADWKRKYGFSEL